mgnify:CR=1 FL=1
MYKINDNYLKLPGSYLFSTIAKKVAVYTQQHPEQEIIRLGIGDVTLPLAAPVVDALHAAVEEMGKKETFHGYGPEQGYGFLKQALMRYYARRGVVLAENEIFVGDGAKSDIGNILDLFDVDNTVLVPDPVYPVYVDTNVMAGRRIVYAAATRENGFLPMPQADVQADLIYLCSPNNPTGAAYSRDQLQAWVDYANERGAVLLFAQCPYDKVLGASNLAMLRYEWVWYKSRCTGFLNARRAPLKRTENILVFYQKLPYYDPQFEQGKPYKKISRTGDNSPNYGKFLRSSSGSEDGLRFPGNLLAFSSVQRTIHPTQKPVELCEYLIRTYTRPGEVVADICAGSGTTAVAAVNTGRRFVCFETAPAFYAPATERIRLATEAVKAGQKGV